MKKIPIASTIQSTVSAMNAACKQSNYRIVSKQLINYSEVLAAFRYEMPEIKIIDFGDPAINAEKCLKVVTDDPWLLFGGVIAIVESQEQKAGLEQRKEPNFLFILTRTEFEKYAEQIVKILNQQEQFLVNRGMKHPADAHESGSFTSDTDPFEIIFYANLIATYLYNTDRINHAERSAFLGAMMELLLNAVEHGNCKISYEEKTQWLKEGKDILALIKLKRLDPEINKKKILITYDISPKRTRITIADDGDGFDWRSALDAPFKAGLHGMGIKMSQTFVQDMVYNDKGNEVSFSVPNQKNTTNLTPAILKNQEMLCFTHLQVVCKQNDQSNNLFYICSGRYAVYVDNILISVLTPADIFIGEMAFLTNNKRSATVIAIGDGSLIKLPKMQFMQLIENYPHYGIFLSRLLAGRLLKQAHTSATLKNELNTIQQDGMIAAEKV
ncbi:MAG: cyclic nucleotide-binding domain-containing protein [Treponema sp.]